VALTPKPGAGRPLGPAGSPAPGTAEFRTRRTERVFIPYGAPEGWQAAVLDHYQAVVAAVCAKLRTGHTQAQRDEANGGSTYHLDVWEGHPLEQQALGFLASVRRQAVALRSAVEAHNATNTRPETAAVKRVMSYVGQVVLDEGEDHDIERWVCGSRYLGWRSRPARKPLRLPWAVRPIGSRSAQPTKPVVGATAYAAFAPSNAPRATSARAVLRASALLYRAPSGRTPVKAQNTFRQVACAYLHAAPTPNAVARLLAAKVYASLVPQESTDSTLINVDVNDSPPAFNSSPSCD